MRTATKVCWSCKERKSLSFFHKDRAIKDGHSGICAECKNRKRREMLLRRANESQ